MNLGLSRQWPNVADGYHHTLLFIGRVPYFSAIVIIYYFFPSVRMRLGEILIRKRTKASEASKHNPIVLLL